MWSLLAWAVADGALPVTAEQQEAVVERDDQAVLGCLQLDRELLRFHHTVVADRLDVRYFKGAATALTFYRRPGLRSYADIDLLIRDEHVDGLRRLLVAQGARPMGTSRWSSYQLEGGFELDIHQTLRHGPFGVAIPTDELFAGPATFKIASQALPTLAPTPALIAAALNAILPQDLRRLSPLRDVAEIAQSGQIDENRVRAVADQWSCSIVVATAMRTAGDFFGLTADTPLLEWARAHEPTSRERRWLEAYHDRTPRYGLKQLWYSTLAQPGMTPRLRFLREQAFHAERDPMLRRVRRVWSGWRDSSRS